MANVKVAVRVRPLSARENADGGKLTVRVEDKFVRIRNVKLEGRTDGVVDSREKLLEFGFDYCYWSVDPADPNYASQEEVFQDLGVSVLSGASQGYNVCLFAYGQTGSGKTYTMMGTSDSIGLTPRICQGLFHTEDTNPDRQNPSRVEISFLEIYNERVRDLLRRDDQKKRTSLRVREHPEKGPYVQDLSQHTVTECKQALDLLEKGIANRMTAATHNHDASSRSHAIFTIQYTQAFLENNLPSETVSKINLVDLAGSERADPQYCRDRLTEGSNINKSLVTLGIVISSLAQNSQMSSSCQSINSVTSEGDGSTLGSHTSSLSSGGGRRHCFIPYRDSVLTWLLKDSLGGNSKTIMIATVSPSVNSYNETLSTLRYAAHARNIINKPRVNEDANVRLIRELREEIERLKSMLLSFELQRNPSPSLSDERDGNLSEIVQQNELKVEQLTKDWSESWRDKKELLEQYDVDINRDRAGFLINSLQPHLVPLDRDVLSTGVVFYHLREGITRIGGRDHFEEPQIVLQGDARCEIENHGGVVMLRPLPGCLCLLNDREITGPCRLAQGTVITLGGVHKFRFNHPAEAAILRERRRASEDGRVCSYADTDPMTHDKNNTKLKPPHELGAGLSPREDPAARQHVEQQQHYVESLRLEIQVEQRRVERELEKEQADLKQQYTDIQEWILEEKLHLKSSELKVTQDCGVQADLLPAPLLEKLLIQKSGNHEDPEDFPSHGIRAWKKTVQDELLKHHALCCAESRFRRKKLQYQLQKIANKRRFLDAKRKLHQLENLFLPGLENPESPEKTESPTKLIEKDVSRRHSFSADLLSRLYPHQTPVFRHFLKRNKSSERALNSSVTPDPARNRKCVSDECLPRERIKSCSELRHQNGGNIKQTANDSLQTHSCLGYIERKRLLPNQDVFVRNRFDEVKSAFKDSSNSQPINKENIPEKFCLNPEKSYYVSDKNFCCADSNELEDNNKMFSFFMDPRIKRALSKMFRKSPSAVMGRRPVKPFGKIAHKFVYKQRGEKSLRHASVTQREGGIKTSVSCEELDQGTTSESHKERRWHSTEALMIMNVGSKDLGEGGFTEHWDMDGATSDCESHFSLDSLSSAYAKALTAQLRLEDSADSEDSEMSKDSLTESSIKFPTLTRCRRTVVPTYSLVTDSVCSPLLNITEPELNGTLGFFQNTVEPFQSHQSLSVSRQVSPTRRSPSESLFSAASRDKVSVQKLTEDFKNMQTTSTKKLESIINYSMKGPGNQILLMDPCSSTDASEIPELNGIPLHPQILIKPSPSQGDMKDVHIAVTENLDISSRSHNLRFLHGVHQDEGSYLEQVQCLETSKNNNDFKSQSTLEQTFSPLTNLSQATQEKSNVINDIDVIDFSIVETGSTPFKGHEAKSGCLPVAQQEETVKSACKNSRKRNKDQPNTLMGSLKIPKRRNSREMATFSCTLGDSLEGIQPDDNKSSSPPEVECFRAETDNQQPDGVCIGDKDSSALAVLAAEFSGKQVEPSGQTPISLLKYGEKSLQHDPIVTENKSLVNEQQREEFEESSKDKHQFNIRRHKDMKAEAICSAIDLRISELVNENNKMSLNGRFCLFKSRSLCSLSSFGCHYSTECSKHCQRDQAEQTKEDDVNKVTEICKNTSVNSEVMKLDMQTHHDIKTAEENMEDYVNHLEHKVKSVLNQSTNAFCLKNMDHQCSFGVSVGNSPSPTSTVVKCNYSASGVFNTKATTTVTDIQLFNQTSAKKKCVQNNSDTPTDNLMSDHVMQDIRADKHYCDHIPPTPHNEGNVTMGYKGKSNPQIIVQDNLQIKVNNKCQNSTSHPSENPQIDMKLHSEEKDDTLALACHFMAQDKVNLGVLKPAPNSSVQELKVPQGRSITNTSCCCSALAKDALLEVAVLPPDCSPLKNKKTKTKRFRKSIFKVCPTSSQDSSLSSTDEDKLSDTRICHSRLASKWVRLNPENVGNKTNLARISHEGIIKSTMGISHENCSKNNIAPKREITPKEKSSHLQAAEQTSLYEKHTEARESPIHFASSDINPFVHHFQPCDSNYDCYKTPTFGSAVDLSCKSPLLNSSEKRILRCCSAENGLNEQNSPFNSHLSTYAANKGLSSTLSSFENYKEDANSKLIPCQKVDMDSIIPSGSQSVNSGSTEECVTRGFGNSLSQEDEIMLLYSSEQQSNKQQSNSQEERRWTREHSTQTEKNLEIVNRQNIDRSLKKKDKHKRSHTEVPSLQKTKMSVKKSTTWTSMENMSAHITKLIDSTSDMLGDIQGMRTGEVHQSSSRSTNSFNNMSHSENIERIKRDCSTQTAFNIGIQTEDFEAPCKRQAAIRQTPKLMSKSYEVDVIVKVIGPEVVRVSHEKKSTSKAEQCQSSEGVQLNSSTSHPDAEHLISSSTKAVGDWQRTAKSTPSQVSKELTGCKRFTVTPKLSKASYEEKPRPTSSKHTFAFLRKIPTYTDRASSPIHCIGGLRYKQKEGQSKHKDPKTGFSSQEADFSLSMDSCNFQRCRQCFSLPSKESDMPSFERMSDTCCSSQQELAKNNFSHRSSLDRSTDCDNRNGYKVEAEYAFATKHKNQKYPSGFKKDSFVYCHDSNHLCFANKSCCLKEDDMDSVAPSECSTEVLLNTEPASLVSFEDINTFPEDLPIHNKFTNWAGVKHQLKHPTKTKTANCAEAGDMEKAGSNMDVLDEVRAEEIMKLRQERARVMSTVSLSMCRTPLTVELTEAKLHYGLGEMDTLLKMLSPRSKEESQPDASASAKQQLHDRHRQSIEVLRREREERLQTCRRARSLSPRKHASLSPQNDNVSPKVSAGAQCPCNPCLPKQEKNSTILLDPRRSEGLYPFEIEHLLRDYGRARVEATTAIAKARERLRERTELEKKRLQQLNLSQEKQNDIKHQTQISNSTLCTGSSLSLSSGPTSGYSSGNAAQLHSEREMNQQILGFRGEAWKPRTRSSTRGPRSVIKRRTWLSAQEISHEHPVKFEPMLASSPSPRVCDRERAASFGSTSFGSTSFGSASSISASFQDFTSSLLSQALAEVRLASFGDLENLVMGKATARWRYQGEERGIRVYYKPSSCLSVHGFLGAAELNRSPDSLWNIICQTSKSHMYNSSLRSVWTRPLDDSTQLVYIQTDPSTCHLSQPRDFCCISTVSKQGGLCTLAMQSVFDESLPRPSVDAVRAEMMPSCWILQPVRRSGQQLTRVICMLQVDLGTPSFPQRLLSTVARRQAAVIADLDLFLTSQEG